MKHTDTLVLVDIFKGKKVRVYYKPASRTVCYEGEMMGMSGDGKRVVITNGKGGSDEFSYKKIKGIASIS